MTDRKRRNEAVEPSSLEYPNLTVRADPGRDGHEDTIADLEPPQADAEVVRGGIVTDNKDPDRVRRAGVLEDISVKYT